MAKNSYSHVFVQSVTNNQTHCNMQYCSKRTDDDGGAFADFERKYPRAYLWLPTLYRHRFRCAFPSNRGFFNEII